MNLAFIPGYTALCLRQLCYKQKVNMRILFVSKLLIVNYSSWQKCHYSRDSCLSCKCLCLDNFSQLSFKIYMSIQFYIMSLLVLIIASHHMKHQRLFLFYIVIRQIFKWLVNKLKNRKRRCSPCASSKEAVHDD
jgi:hypothetical protein